ncbi:hypothetical protein [Deinococcus ficus]|uniref:Uncharacterized protein n=1 Tax=Deinococcus ficus TaxID=317577 RepID=A0A221SVS4_9DEIO|nr:hypothetical protein [Deinococcus ficus]ASN80759.1 hypothetical protein DFI_06870 [Deinococcus ficus]
MASDDPLTRPEIQHFIARMSAVQATDPLNPYGPFMESDVRMEDLFNLLGHEDAGELLATAVDRSLLSLEQAEAFLGIGIWSGRTNGSDFIPTLDQWLEDASSRVRVHLALHMDVLPFGGPRNREARGIDALTLVADRFPEYADECAAIIVSLRSFIS